MRCSLPGKTPNPVFLFSIAYHLETEKENKTLSVSRQIDTAQEMHHCHVPNISSVYSALLSRHAKKCIILRDVLMFSFCDDELFPIYTFFKEHNVIAGGLERINFEVESSAQFITPTSTVLSLYSSSPAIRQSQ